MFFFENFFRLKKKIFDDYKINLSYNINFGSKKANNFFREKLKNDESWINGGFFVIKKQFLDTISNKKTYLEKKPFINAVRKGQMIAYKHNDFWQCMDTRRDVDYLNNLFKQKKLNWL